MSCQFKRTSGDMNRVLTTVAVATVAFLCAVVTASAADAGFAQPAGDACAAVSKSPLRQAE